MSKFNLQILTPNKVVVNSEVEKVIIRTTEGDVGILKNHADYVAAINNGPINIFYEGNHQEKANVTNGFISVLNGDVSILVLSYNKEVN